MLIPSVDKRFDRDSQRTECDQNPVALNVRRSNEYQRRIMLLNSLIEGMRSGKVVTERQIRAAISQNEWDRYDEAKHSATLPKVPTSVRQQFSKYNALLRRADRRFDEAENSAGSRMMRRRTCRPDLQSPHRLAERDYEHALEILEELLQCEPRVSVFLDRPVSFGLDSALNPDQESVPRLKTSRSPYRLQNGKRWQSNRDLQLSTLRASRGKVLIAMEQLGRLVKRP